MACSNNKCSGCGSCCNNSFARVGCSSCTNRSGCGCNSWNNWNNWSNWNNWNRSGCSSCGCSGCSSCSSCGCNSCNSARSGCGCSSCCDTWNCGRSGCGSSCDSGFGLLRSVSGPYNRCINGLRFPFYTGPCGPCESDCCCLTDCCDDCCDSCNDCCDDCGSCCTDDCCDCCNCASSATFAGAAPVNLAAGDSVELSCTTEDQDDFTATREGIRIHRTGRYMVIYTVHVPANEIVSSRFLLTLNGDRVASSAADVATVANGTTNGYSMHAMLYAPADSLLKLVSLNPVSICPGAASNVFTLSISKID